MFFAPLIPAGIATLGAAGRVVNSPTGQRIIQGGINTLNRFGIRLQDFLQPASQMITQQAIHRPISAGSVIPFAIDETSNTISNLINKLIEEDEDKDEDKKDKKKKKTKKDEIPEVPMMKKGGMAKPKKPKKKRKKYKSSTFVKMKGSKKYI